MNGTFQDWKWVYRSSNKGMHNSFSVALGKLESRRLNCHSLLKCYYQCWVSHFFMSSLFFPCFDLSLSMPSLERSECPSLGRILYMS
jgi:hypothetical protein